MKNNKTHNNCKNKYFKMAIFQKKKKKCQLKGIQ